ncbi:MAG: small multi-drug export protein [Bacillaceae bacterium]|nr:small multi-drug export protein [Bacillaceae bacterium]
MKEVIQSFIVDNLGFLPSEALVVIISAMPILELRGGIPFARLAELHWFSAFSFSVIGNLLAIVPILLLFRPISSYMMRFGWYKQFFDWLYNRTMKKSKNVEKFGALGLILFTAIPLPTTGAYSACLAAILFFIPFRTAVIAITTGVFIAGVGVTTVVYFLI